MVQLSDNLCQSMHRQVTLTLVRVSFKITANIVLSKLYNCLETGDDFVQ